MLRQARESGARVVDGPGMLVRQGALALGLWTNRGPEVEELEALMRAACEQVLRR